MPGGSRNEASLKFNIVVLEPTGYPYGHFLHYFCKLICQGLQSLRHDCIISRNALDPGRTTIVVGGHLIASPAQAQSLASVGPYVVLQTELIKDGTRAFWQGGSGYESVYCPLLQRARAVWEVIPDQMATLDAVGARGQLLLGGYHPALEEVSHKQIKDIDFLFFGTPTPHRAAQLEALERRGRTVVVVFDEHSLFRNDLIARTRVNLSLRTTASAAHLPWGRICELLNNRGLVVSETCADQAWLADCFVSASTETWLDVCEETLLRADREQLAGEFWERFKSRPFTERLAKVLDETPLL